MQEYWIRQGETLLHCLDSHIKDEGGAVPLLISPGLSEPAENYMETIHALWPQRCIVLAHRGRGKSSAPMSGYSLEDHVEDIKAVVRFFNLQNFYLMGYSRGVSYALGYALEETSKLKGLILAEYPAVHKQMGPGWADQYLQTFWGNERGSNLMAERVVRGIEQEAQQHSFGPMLHQIPCPTLILRGTGEDSLLSKEEATRYQNEIRNTQVVVFEHTGHTLKESEFAKFIRTIRGYLQVEKKT
ncbi:alpha/beta fold hydrolase [Marinococcus luteus]|uniref:alpha/beta fold hydrolase n=1 Tax=Marinococcus luteus TaxID=1122204 RepID=UPI002ACCA5FE|nr:alpha/beta fold hydrolase [Marinococcus luteus]MDZ5782395.1 alpha/beta fold hydrolase [Marinococcus luteus]